MGLRASSMAVSKERREIRGWEERWSSTLKMARTTTLGYSREGRPWLKEEIRAREDGAGKEGRPWERELGHHGMRSAREE
jgi:hypothetical protein